MAYDDAQAGRSRPDGPRADTPDRSIPLQRTGGGLPGDLFSSATDRLDAGEPATALGGATTRSGPGPSNPWPGSTAPSTGPDDEDEPAQADGSDRLGVHWLWELVLVLVVAAFAALLWQADPTALRGDGFAGLLLAIAGYALLGTAVSLSLRASVPNLAAGAMAAAAAVWFAEGSADGAMAPTVVVAVAAAVLGLAVALLVTVLHVPGWAATLAVGAGVVVWLHQQPPEVFLTGGYDATRQAASVFLVVAVVSIVGGLFATLRPVRRLLGRYRPVGDPAVRPGAAAAVTAAVATVLSMVMATGAGVVLAAGSESSVPGSAGSWWLELTMVGLAVALVGGTSAFGRRGGVFGTVLAALAIGLFDRYQMAQGWSIALLATAAVAVAGGLVVTRLVERYGRYVPDELEDDWEPSAPRAEQRPLDSWSDSWTSVLPAQPAPPDQSSWSDRWGR